ncbi:PilN domain-containing protein [Simiduia aestuariiviva]|uniref:Type IV pilus assembly protein PilN n=1 Tax=Simiduia aestuariiviva TaxID=1510459 RepID=A0A839UI89_9GAMM|nr:PilN domain-containing protein [Simiduia aestuariiviva]MBB3167223.1 type IV pilus assembly protein PilN [Simiduia aestuariiviva]
MSRINLLPWRDQYRQEKKQEYFTILGGVFMLTAALAYFWVSSVQGAIEYQNQRNALLQREIQLLEKQVAEIRDLKKRKAELLDRMRVIQGLQGTRPVIVRYFDEMARAIPDGVFLLDLKRTGERVEFKGIAESNNRVSSLMRNLDESEWFDAPNLTSVKAAPEEGELANEFSMSVRTTVPSSQQEEVK